MARAAAIFVSSSTISIFFMLLFSGSCCWRLGRSLKNLRQSLRQSVMRHGPEGGAGAIPNCGIAGMLELGCSGRIDRFRQNEREGASFAQGAFHGNRSAMELNEFTAEV